MATERSGMTNTWGGKRPNAGRKPTYNEPTKKLSVPVSLYERCLLWIKTELSENNAK